MTGVPLRVAVLGAGTVGGEVVRGLLDPTARLRSPDGGRLELVGIAVRDLAAARRRGLPAALLTDAPAHLVAAPDTDVVVELMGGDEPARTLIAAALGAGKAVVTANKHVLAHHGPELEGIARGAGAPLRFEAAVAGGIPILGPLVSELAANRVRRIRGIVNGTTNYILTAMAAGAGTYDGVLREAQERGYAETDPSGDVEGRDAINKLVVLGRLAFGQWLDPAGVADRPPALRSRGRPGITGVMPDELAAAAALGLTVRLLATAMAGDEAGRVIAASVVPTAVPADSPLGRTNGVTNRVEVTAEPLGQVGFDGPGAGGPATSSAVLGDLVALAQGRGSTWAGLAPASRAAASEADPLAGERRWFVLLPDVRLDAGMRGIVEAEAAVPGGVALRTGPADVQAVRRAFAPVGLDADPALYPIDD